MQRNLITSHSAVALLITIIICNNMVMGLPGNLKQDSWVAVIFSLAGTIPLAMVYARMIKLMPGKDLFDMLECTVGKWLTKIISLLFGLYCLHIAALVLITYTNFAHMTSLFLTPRTIISMLLMVVVIHLGRSGLNAMSRWTMMIIILTLFILTINTALLFPKMQFENLLPTLVHPVGDIIKTAGKITLLPFGDTVILLGFIGGLEKKANPYKIFLAAIIAATLYQLIVFIRTCTVLGQETMSIVFFPSYRAVAIIELGSFLERIEAVMAIFYILASMAKTSCAIVSSAKGLAKVCSFRSYRIMIVPLGFVAVALTRILFQDMVGLFDFINVYYVYAVPFQVLIPVLIWLVAEVKNKKGTLPKPEPEKEDASAVPA